MEVEDFLNAMVLKIKFLRKQRKISQLELAHILGHNSPNYIAKIETRKHGVSYNISHLYAIARAFELEVSDLLPSYAEVQEYINNKTKDSTIDNKTK